MRRPGPPVVLRRDGGEGGGCYALRFRALGKRRYCTLGTFDEGWTDERAQAAAEDLHRQLQAGTWTPSFTLREVVATVLESTPSEQLGDADAIASRVIAEADPDQLQAEVHQMVLGLVSNVIASRTPSPGRHDRRLDLAMIVKPAGDAKRLGECTIADVDTLAYERELVAKALLASAAEWRGLAAVMRAEKASTVGALGVEKAEAAMRRGVPYRVVRNDDDDAQAVAA